MSGECANWDPSNSDKTIAVILRARERGGCTDVKLSIQMRQAMKGTQVYRTLYNENFT